MRRPVRRQSYLFVFLVIAGVLLLAHGPILDLPFYWDEVGQFVPASLDLYHSGALIPHSTIPNVHPPGLMAYLALFWHITGYSIAATRIAMLLLAALGVLCAFLLAIELGRGSPGAPALIAPALLCCSPLFFAQSMLAELDMPAMAFTVLALLLFLQNRFRASALVCVALVLVKETGIAAPLLFGAWLVVERRVRDAVWFITPFIVLGCWLLLLKKATGHWLGNAEFAQYNLVYSLDPVRIILALLRRLYYLFIGSGHIFGTLAVVWAVRRMPLFRDRAWRVAIAFTALHVLMVSALGGAVLERYLLPVLPILYAAFGISLGALLPQTRKIVLGALLLCLIVANLVPPPYPFPFENNLAFLSFVDVQREAAAAVDVRHGTIATTFPMSNSLRRPDYGYVSSARAVIEMKSFVPSEVARMAQRRPDMMVVYDTTWDPLHLLRVEAIRHFLERWYRYETPMTPGQIGEVLSMRIAGYWERHGISMTLLVRDAGQVRPRAVI